MVQPADHPCTLTVNRVVWAAQICGGRDTDEYLGRPGWHVAAPAPAPRGRPPARLRWGRGEHLQTGNANEVCQWCVLPTYEGAMIFRIKTAL